LMTMKRGPVFEEDYETVQEDLLNRK